MIRKDGYYISEVFSWVDWHAGHKFEEKKFYLLKFLTTENVIRASNKSNKITATIFQDRMNYVDNYLLLDDKTLEITLNPQSKWSVKRQFTIVSPEILLDEDLKEYRFVPSTPASASL